MGEHQRDHLRVLVDDERPQLGGIGLVEEAEGHLDGGGVETVDDQGGPLGSERLLEHLVGEGESAATDVLPSGHEVAELGHHRLRLAP